VGSVLLRFFEELNDFLPLKLRKKWFGYGFRGKVSVKDLIESTGVPHTEIDLIIADGEPVTFDYIIKHEDTISVYPLFRSLDIDDSLRLRPEPLPFLKFVIDVHLGRLAGFMRLIGLDSLYGNFFDDEELANISSTQSRVLLTRDRNLLKRNQVKYGYFVRNNIPKDQIREVVNRFDLWKSLEPFTRCIHCNGSLYPVQKDDIRHLITVKTLNLYSAFQRCNACGKVYWRGSHYQKLKQFVTELIDSNKKVRYSEEE